jgi:hypothetical protein
LQQFLRFLQEISILLYPLSSQILCFMILLMLCHSLFLSPLTPSSIEWFHYYKHALHMSLCMFMLVFVYMFTFWIYLPHMRENMWPFSFWAWLTPLNIMSPSCIQLLSNHMIPYDWVKLQCVYISQFLGPLISYGASGLFP